jgi:hypothetical protein
VDVEFGLLPIPFVKTIEFLDIYTYLYFVGSISQSVNIANFVKRYNDHYRVIKKMVAYAGSCGAAPAQLEYIHSILAKLCFTHYMLSTFYDEDTSRGRARAREFDKWLKAADKKLYEVLSDSLYIRILRRENFSLLPKGRLFKRTVKKVSDIFKPVFRKRRRFTY